MSHEARPAGTARLRTTTGRATGAPSRPVFVCSGMGQQWWAMGRELLAHELIGEVHNMKQPSDIEGTYTATQASVAVAGGSKVAELKNDKGVVLKIKGSQVGLEFAVDLSGMGITLKK